MTDTAPSEVDDLIQEFKFVCRQDTPGGPLVQVSRDAQLVAAAILVHGKLVSKSIESLDAESTRNMVSKRLDTIVHVLRDIAVR